MMKFLITVFAALLSYSVSSAQADSITIKGELINLNDNKLSISWEGNDGKIGSAKAQAKNNRFSVRVPAQKMPVVARLFISLPVKKGDRSAAYTSPFNFFIWNKDITLNGDATFAAGIRLKGDRQNELYNNLRQTMAAAERKHMQLINKLTDTTSKLSATDSAKTHGQLMATYRENSSKEKAFVRANPGAFASVFILSRTANSYGADEYIATWNALKPTYKNTVLGRSVAKRVEELIPTQAGTPVFSFERFDKDGNKVSPASMNGRVYILDFWGSWCGPCRASHPHLKELYNKYKSKGFEIIAIAQERGKTLEQSKNSWLKAIEEDGIDWVHILNQDGIETQNLVKTFHVKAFPTKILVGSDGKIITRTTSGASNAIDKALEKIYGF